MLQIPQYKTKKELYKFLSENKETLLSFKKAEMKRGDAINYTHSITDDGKVIAIKEDFQPIDTTLADYLKVTAIINTTNIMDSHYDVHIPGLWNKSLQENKFIKHLREHEMEFDYIIADKQDLKAYVKFFKWSEFGYDYPGVTQALVFDSIVRKSRNQFMLNQYANGWVDNHSVGMRYMKLGLAMNDPEYPNEYEAWVKYYPEIVNKEVPEEIGYFYYVLEAQVIEGSAVPIGSNHVTPTYSVGTKEIEDIKNEIKTLKELVNSFGEPQNEPDKSTQLNALENKIKFLELVKNEFKK
jgi:hypothetical protein